MEKEILEKNKQYLKKLYFEWLEYFDVWNLSDYDENDLIAFIEDLEKHNEFEDEIKTMKMYLRLAKRDQKKLSHFLKKYIRESHELGKELFDAYPPFVEIKGKFYSLKSFTKAGLFSLEDFCIFYAKSIKNAKITHEKVMEALQFGIENNLINYSILEFISSRKYLEIDFIKNSDNINGYSNSELL